jgi:SAM-dependent methyltransferase
MGRIRLCIEECRRGYQLGDPACPNAHRLRGVPNRDEASMFRCTRSGLIFTDIPHIFAEQWPGVAGTRATSEVGEPLAEGELERKHLRHFGANLRMTDEAGNVYHRVGYDQNELRFQHSQRILRLVERYVNLDEERPIRILEVGCASGFLLADLWRSYPNARLTGVDPSTLSCAQANTHEGVTAHCGTLDSISFPSGSFDVVIMVGTLMLHPNPERSIRQVWGLVDERGLLIVDTKNPNASVRRLARGLSRFGAIAEWGRTRRMLRRSHDGMRFGLSKEWLMATIEASGWQILAMRTLPPRLLGVPSSHSYGRGLIGAFWRLFDALDRVIGERAWIEAVCIKPKTRVTDGDGGPGDSWGFGS